MATALVVGAAGTVGAVAALRGRDAGTLSLVVPVTSSASRVGGAEQGAPQPLPEPLTAPLASPPRMKSAVSARSGAAKDRFTAELELLQRAQLAYTRREFPSALMLIVEHARRFPRGHLAEEREALRVRSLRGAGRVDQARRAAAEFAVRFPRSVLLQRVDSIERD